MPLASRQRVSLAVGFAAFGDLRYLVGMHELPKGTLTFIIDRGPHEGTVSTTYPEFNHLMLMAWSNTRRGEVGRKFSLASDGMLEHLKSGGEVRSPIVQGHTYEIVSKEVNGDDVTLRCKYLGPDDISLQRLP